MTIKAAIQAIVDNQDNKSVNYAVNYAKEALTMRVDSDIFRTQLTYIRMNITYWRGGIAKQVRQAISAELSR